MHTRLPGLSSVHLLPQKELLQAIRDVISNVTGQKLPDPLPEPELVAYGQVGLKQAVSLLDNLDKLHMEKMAFSSNQPQTMEAYGMAYGILSYSYDPSPAATFWCSENERCIVSCADCTCTIATLT